MSATCQYCEQQMELGVGCTDATYDDFPDGIARDRVPYDPNYGGPEQTCRDCGVRRGQLHHPGCDTERCPRCGRQAISCECALPEDDEACRQDERRY